MVLCSPASFWPLNTQVSVFSLSPKDALFSWFSLLLVRSSFCQARGVRWQVRITFLKYKYDNITLLFKSPYWQSSPSGQRLYFSNMAFKDHHNLTPPGFSALSLMTFLNCFIHYQAQYTHSTQTCHALGALYFCVIVNHSLCLWWGSEYATPKYGTLAYGIF